MTFYGPQSCLQRIQTSKIPNTFPNMHPRAKATSPTGTPGPGHSNGFLRLSKLPFASPQTLQNSPNAPNLPKPAKPSKHRPQQAPQIHSNDFLDAFKAALTGGPPKPAKPSKHRPQQAPQIHSNDFLDAFKAAVCQPAKAATPLKFQTPSLTGGQGHSNDFLWASKLQFAASPTGTPGPGPQQ